MASDRADAAQMLREEGSVAVVSQAPARVPPAVELYAGLLNDFFASRGRVKIESLYVAGTRAAEALVVPANGDSVNALEGLDEATYSWVQAKMKGFKVWHWEEGDAAFPDPTYFLALSRTRGDAADTAFFEALSATYSLGSPWPVYEGQQTDYSGCVEFGPGRLLETFARWDAFAASHPERYEEQVNAEVRNLEDALLSDCACGDRGSVLAELKAFVGRFPSAKLTLRVLERIQAIESGLSKLRAKCVSG